MTPSEPPPPPPIVSAPPPPPVISAPAPPPTVQTEDEASESVWGVALRVFGVGLITALVLGGIVLGVLVAVVDGASPKAQPAQPSSAVQP